MIGKVTVEGMKASSKIGKNGAPLQKSAIRTTVNTLISLAAPIVMAVTAIALVMDTIDNLKGLKK